MSEPAKRMHLGAIVLHTVSNQADCQWAHPRDKVGLSFAEPEYWQSLARTLERGCFDAMFLADVQAPYDVYRGSADDTFRYAVQCPMHDPLVLVPVVALATEHLGIGVTASTTFDAPYTLARRLATLDHLTRGRLGWNVVTSFHRNAFKAMGIEPIPHDERYERAEEFLEICYRLWDSWEPDAVVYDRAGKLYADPAKVHRVTYEGRYYRCDSPSFVQPSPQRRPVIWQAGSSGRGRDFAAKHAEAVFALQPTAGRMRAYCDDIRARTASLGRDPDALRILFQLQVVVGETAEQARERYDSIVEQVTLEGALTIISGHFGFDFSTVDLDQPLADVEATGVRSGLEGLLVLAEESGTPLTLREAALLYAIAGAAPLVVGDPEQVADAMIELMDEGGGDGFILMSTYTPGCYEEFVDLVVPVLQARGRFRTGYTGRTLREHMLER